MGGTTSIDKERSIRGIEPIKSNCGNCLYMNRGICKFNKSTKNRKHCIKYEYAQPSPRNRRKPKISTEKVVVEKVKNVAKVEKVINKTSFIKLSHFFGLPITRERLPRKYKSYSNGYSIKNHDRNNQPLTVAIRSNRTQQEKIYEIIE